jgi:hypothetical protein
VVSISATFPHDILEVIRKFMIAPPRILVNGGEMTLEVNTIQVVLSPIFMPF